MSRWVVSEEREQGMVRDGIGDQKKGNEKEEENEDRKGRQERTKTMRKNRSLVVPLVREGGAKGMLVRVRGSGVESLKQVEEKRPRRVAEISREDYGRGK